MNAINIAILEYIHKMKKTIAPIIQANGQSPDVEICRYGYSAEQEIIKDVVKKEDPLFLGRMGSIELNALCNYLQKENLLKNIEFTSFNYCMDRCWPIWWSKGAKNGMQNNAGFFPVEDKYLDKWGEMMVQDLQELTHLLTWQKNETYIEPFMKNLKGKINNYQVYYPIAHENPWTEILNGKKVLVISPFAKTIEQQYFTARKFIHFNKKILPVFDLETIKSFNFLRGITDGKIDTWFQALGIMEEQILKKQFDIALLGCGAYAFNLGAFIKRLGKTAVTMCGGLPLLFGIYGNRYERWLRESNILNEFWRRPSDDEKPVGYRYVENGAYW